MLDQNGTSRKLEILSPRNVELEINKCPLIKIKIDFRSWGRTESAERAT